MASNELSSAPAPASAGKKYQKVKNSNPRGWQFYCPERNFLPRLRQIPESDVSRSLIMTEMIRIMSRRLKSLSSTLCPQDWFLDCCLEILQVSHKMLVWTLTKVVAGNIIRAGSDLAGTRHSPSPAHVSTCPGRAGSPCLFNSGINWPYPAARGNSHQQTHTFSPTSFFFLKDSAHLRLTIHHCPGLSLCCWPAPAHHVPVSPWSPAPGDPARPTSATGAWAVTAGARPIRGQGWRDWPIGGWGWRGRHGDIPRTRRGERGHHGGHVRWPGELYNLSSRILSISRGWEK